MVTKVAAIPPGVSPPTVPPKGGKQDALRVPKPPGLLDIRFIGTVEKQICAISTEVTVDSAAEESVCPVAWGEHFGLDPVQPGKHMSFVNASGGPIAHHGSRKVVVRSAAGQKLSMNFQVADVQKPLLAVSRLLEQGNMVQFGNLPGHSFIMNVATGEKLLLERRSTSWVIPGHLVGTERI